MRLLSLLPFFLFSYQIFAQCCCGDLDFRIQIPAELLSQKAEINKNYFELIFNHERHEKQEIQFDETGKIHFRIGSDCGYQSILLKIPLGDETMSINFTHVPGDTPLFLGTTAWRAGNFEIYMLDMQDELRYYRGREDQAFNELQKYMHQTEFSEPVKLIEQYSAFIVQRDSLRFPMLKERNFMRELNRNGQCEMQLQQWIGPGFGWTTVSTYIFKEIQQGIKWNGNNSGRFRFVLISGTGNVEYVDFYVN